ncbi:15265_t:CDS:1, partial [Entrophospora sp. SA101]
MSTQENTATKPTWKDFEKAIIEILRAGIYYRKPKDKGFMSWYKKLLTELHSAEEPEMYVYEKAIDKFPNEEVYNQTMEEFKSYYKKELKI